MRPLALLVLLVAFSAQANDDPDKKCEAAVDAADSMNVNQKDCDYSDKGLNGFLQKAFKKGDEGAVLETSTAAEQKAESQPTPGVLRTTAEQKIAVTKVAETKAAEVRGASKAFTLEVEVDQWANLPVARAQLLPKALEKCGKGFSVVGEHYRSLGMGKIELQLAFECDQQ